jgi:alkylated DNA repair protein alkB homolog 8
VNARKSHKKVLKCLLSVSKEIPSIKRSEKPSVNILIANVGLVTGCSREEIVQIFKEFGPIQNVYMLPGKSYCFIQFEFVESSIKCINVLNGAMQNIENVTKPLYLCYIESSKLF